MLNLVKAVVKEEKEPSELGEVGFDPPLTLSA
jgi:hypothetical protein